MSTVVPQVLSSSTLPVCLSAALAITHMWRHLLPLHLPRGHPSCVELVVVGVTGVRGKAENRKRLQKVSEAISKPRIGK